MNTIAPLLEWMFWFGPAAALLLASLILEQRRNAHNGDNPGDNIVLRSLGGGFIAAVAFVIIIMLLAIVRGSGNAGPWIVFAPWAFALGQAVGLVWRRAPSEPGRS
jgi:hypothetical protein